jgi:ABC-type transport system involved in multi-copper enzyme maturation permease subunit
MILRQTKAMLIDAYRELNAKKLFWLTMILNLLAVIGFASIGINERGFSFLFWTIEGEFNTSVMSKSTFYKFEFITWGIPIWLSWGTTVLALISTAGIIPDLVSGGTIEPLLSKPISRVRLFLTKYLTGLGFVAAQVFIFSAGCFLVLGIRAGSWEFGMFLAIPIVLAFFSYLFSVCAFIGIVTRSTITSLLLTIVFFLLVFGVHLSEAITISGRENAAVQIEDAQDNVKSQERFATKQIEKYKEQGKPIPGQDGEPIPPGRSDTFEAVNPTLTFARENLAKAQRKYDSWEGWADWFIRAKVVLPKTQETIGLLERNLINDDEFDGFIEMVERLSDDGSGNQQDPRANDRIQAIYAGRSMTWILGTSFAFEAFFLGLSTLIFVRRDF